MLFFLSIQIIFSNPKFMAMEQDNPEKQEKRKATSTSISKFIHSRGCPIRYLSNLEATKVPKVMLALKHEDAAKE